MQFSQEFIIMVATIIGWAVICMLHAIPPIWRVWEKFTQSSPWVHRGIAVYALTMTLVNIWLIMHG